MSQVRVITPHVRRALAVAELEAGEWADARIPGAGHRHMKVVPEPEQAELIERVRRLLARLAAAR